uniref:Uncharacterized protein n=1 Tax=Arundo donax TaxID=35708 RepID=A0A0A9C0S9_ARUDO
MMPATFPSLLLTCCLRASRAS